MSLGLAKANKIKTLGIPTFEIELENYRDSNYKDNLVSLVPAGFDAYCWKDIKNIENKNPDGIVNVNDIDKTFDKNTFFCGYSKA